MQKRKGLADKLSAAVDEFVDIDSDEDLKIEGTSPSTDTDKVTVTDTSTSTGTTTVTNTDTVTGTLLDVKPVELMNRHVCYLNKVQSEYVRKMAKKHKVKESEIIRIAINMLMKG